VNDAYTATTKLAVAGEEVYWLNSPVTAGGKSFPAGTIYIPAKASTAAHVERLAKELGVEFTAVTAKPQGEALKIRPVKVGLWDRYGGSMDSGWIRWMFEQAFPTPYELVFAQALDAGDLKSKFDVLVFPEGAIPAGEGGRGGGGGGGGGGGFGGGQASVPDEFKAQSGSITLAKTGPQLRKFVEDGGTLIGIGRSASFGTWLGLPMTSALVETTPNGTRRLPNDKFYIPGSILQAAVDTSAPVAYGLPEKLDIFYNNDPAFRLLPDAALKNTRPVAWFGSGTLLRSGWAWGESYLNGTTAVVEATLGKGKLFLFGPEITFSGQPHGTFKFLFNALQLAGAEQVTLR
jgi:hypothetical protein